MHVYTSFIDNLLHEIDPSLQTQVVFFKLSQSWIDFAWNPVKSPEGKSPDSSIKSHEILLNRYTSSIFSHEVPRRFHHGPRNALQRDARRLESTEDYHDSDPPGNGLNLP